jgi:dienelactone hydrolase
MNRRQFVMQRAAFTGIPYSMLCDIENSLDAGQEWHATLIAIADKHSEIARQVSAAGRTVTAGQHWRLAGAAYHSATFAPDVQRMLDIDAINALRRNAVSMYRQALAAAPSSSLVQFALAGSTVNAYLHLPAGDVAGLVVLLNGLDSLCEVEMHAFSEGMLERGMATLAIDLPAQFSSPHRKPTMAIEDIEPSFTEWRTRAGFGNVKTGVFGVSFGAYLAARMLSQTELFSAGVLLSPPAWIGERERAHGYLMRMLRWTFDCADSADDDAVADQIRLADLSSPRAATRLYTMQQDALFGGEHRDAYLRWGGSVIEEVLCDAEHVGTSRFPELLPAAFDWLQERLRS